MRFLNYDGLGHLINEIKSKFVQKVSGKDLSTNDFNNTFKSKLEGIENGAEVNEVSATDLAEHTEATGNVHSIPNVSTTVTGLMTPTDKKKLNTIEEGATTNVIEVIKRNGTVLTVDSNKAVDIPIPTKYSDLANDKTYQTKAEILTLIADNGKLKKEVVAALPNVSTADDNTMYLITNSDGSGFEEWIVINGMWEKLGDTSAIDLSGYIKTTDVSIITTTEIDAFLNA